MQRGMIDARPVTWLGIGLVVIGTVVSVAGWLVATQQSSRTPGGDWARTGSVLDTLPGYSVVLGIAVLLVGVFAAVLGYRATVRNKTMKG
jgi:hypothetical protein